MNTDYSYACKHAVKIPKEHTESVAESAFTLALTIFMVVVLSAIIYLIPHAL
jgi:hypothetical protein